MRSDAKGSSNGKGGKVIKAGGSSRAGNKGGKGKGSSRGSSKGGSKGVTGSKADSAWSAKPAALDAILPALSPLPPSLPEEEAHEARREKLLRAVRSARNGGAEQRKLMARWNEELPPRNAARFPPPPPGALPVVLLVYERASYLEVSLRLFAMVSGLNSTTLVVSHQGTQPDVWAAVARVGFCRVKQLLYPHHAEHADLRGALALKLHFTWAVASTFALLPEAEELVYMEDDFWPTPDFYSSAVRLRASRERFCPECVGSIVGEHPRDWHERHVDSAAWLAPNTRALLHKPYVGCNFNSPAGMAMPRKSWRAIEAHAAAYCDREVHAYDDAIHLLQNTPPHDASPGGASPPRRVLEPGWLTNAYPRCVHVGRCGGLSFRLDATLGTQEERAAACNVTRDAQDFAAIWVAPWRRGGPFAVPKLSATPPDNARSAWRVDDGLKLCRGRYTPANASAALVGVARGNNATSSAYGEQLCLTMLRAAT